MEMASRKRNNGLSDKWLERRVKPRSRAGCEVRRVKFGPWDLVARRCVSGLRGVGPAALLGLSMLLVPAREAAATQPLIWDDDQNGMDDRIETVQLLGYRFSFEGADTLARQRFEVTGVGANLIYGVYVVFTAPPSQASLLALTLLGMPVLYRYEGIPAVRCIATFAQAMAARSISG